MKKIILAVLAFSSLVACNESDRKLGDSTEDATNTGTTFLYAVLDGNFLEAKKLLVPDSTNLQYFEGVIQRKYQKYPNELKAGYREASIRIHKSEVIDSLTTILKYSNSYTNKPDSIRLQKIDGKWLVDLKYLFGASGDGDYKGVGGFKPMDSVVNKP